MQSKKEGVQDQRAMEPGAVEAELIREKRVWRVTAKEKTPNMHMHLQAHHDHGTRNTDVKGDKIGLHLCTQIAPHFAV